MEITRRKVDEIVEVELAGRLDGYWCDHLSAAFAEMLRDGNHHIRLDCSQVSYLTSAGISVLLQFSKELRRINGTFHIVNPSAAVLTVLRITRLDALLMAPTGEVRPTSARERPTRRLEHPDIGFEVFDLDPPGTLTCRAVGTSAPLAKGVFGEEHCTTFEAAAPALAIGIGAFGTSFVECRRRFGELISVGGAAAYQPGDGTNVADYLVTGGALSADIRLLYYLACDGRFSHLVRFDTLPPKGAVGLSRLLAGCFEAAASNSLGVVIVAEAAGLVGAALRQSPTDATDAAGFFAHPGVRSRLTFTTERAFPRSVALAAGVATRNGIAPDVAKQLRPIGPDCAGHFHAAAFRFRPLRRGAIDLGETVTGLFEPEQLLGVLHLLNDDRAVAGSGESEFVRGACWIAPIAGGQGQV